MNRSFSVRLIPATALLVTALFAAAPVDSAAKDSVVIRAKATTGNDGGGLFGTAGALVGNDITIRLSYDAADVPADGDAASNASTHVASPVWTTGTVTINGVTVALNPAGSAISEESWAFRSGSSGLAYDEVVMSRNYQATEGFSTVLLNGKLGPARSIFASGVPGVPNGHPISFTSPDLNSFAVVALVGGGHAVFVNAKLESVLFAPDAARELRKLRTTVVSLDAGPGVTNPLAAFLANAIDALSDGKKKDVSTARKMVGNFQSLVEMNRGKKLAEATADELGAAANVILLSLSLE